MDRQNSESSDSPMKILEKNLKALVSRQPKMVQRICWPVDGSHVGWTEDKQAFYRLASSSFPLQLKDDDVEKMKADVSVGEDVFIFGLGLGEHVDYLLDESDKNKVVVWDRDPWFVRSYLMERDVSDALATGKLEIAMCGDLISFIRRGIQKHVVSHPLLRELYKNEWQMLDMGLGARRVLINADGLFVDDVAAALKKLGFTTFYSHMNRISLEEIEYTIVQYLPSVVFSINYYNGLAELCEKFGLTLLCWEIDPCLDDVQKIRVPSKRSHIFSFRKRNVDGFKAAGFESSYYLPLATNSQRRRPASLTEEERARYTCQVSFVGSSMSENAPKFRNRFRDLYTEFLDNGMLGFSKAEKLFREILDIQRRDYAAYVIPEILEKRCGNFLKYVREIKNDAGDPIAFLGEVAASEKRLAFISGLGEYDVKVWGDEGWKFIESAGGKYMGYAGHKHELNKIYTASAINVDVNRLYQPDIVTMRTFDIMACGGFVLAEYSQALGELFDIGTEIVTYRTFHELTEKIKYYLTHVAEREKIAEAGMEAVRKRHTIEKRVREMLQVAQLPYV